MIGEDGEGDGELRGGVFFIEGPLLYARRGFSRTGFSRLLCRSTDSADGCRVDAQFLHGIDRPEGCRGGAQFRHGIEETVLRLFGTTESGEGE